MKLLKHKDLRKSLFIVLILFAIYKVGTYIPAPGVNNSLIKDIFESNQALGFVNMFSGGALSNFSIFAIGVMPYITASIVIQLLAMNVVPTLTEWRRQGEDGQKKIKKLTYQVSMVLAFLQAIGLSLGFNKMVPGVVEPSFVNYALIAVTLTAGTGILLIFAEIIERKGIGKGISMIILAGILMTIPQNLYQYIITEKGETWYDFMFILQTVLIALMVFVLTLVIIQVQRGERRVPITNSRSAVAQSKVRIGKDSSYLPFKLNPSGVIPVIFAMAFFMTPRVIAMLFPDAGVSQWITQYVDYTNPIGMTIYGLLIFGFTYFYSFVVANPEKMAENLKISGNFVPGYRPGKETEKLFKYIVKHLTFSGAVFLSVVAIIPLLVSQFTNLPEYVLLGGTSIIIIVSVLVDIKDSTSAKILKTNYRGFLRK